jgi:hypothetical protein
MFETFNRYNYVLQTRHDVGEWEEGTHYATKFNTADTERFPRYRHNILNNPDLLEMARKIFVIIASG